MGYWYNIKYIILTSGLNMKGILISPSLGHIINPLYKYTHPMIRRFVPSD